MKRLFFQEAPKGASSALKRMALVLTAAIAGSAVSAGAASTAWAGEQKRLDVLELFTSQGCSSCPPADRLLGELAKRDNVLVLSFPVSYWDNLGWKDTLAQDAYNERQRTYAAVRGDRLVYTPQLIVNGMSHAVGSQIASIEAAIESTGEALRGRYVPVSLSYAGNAVKVETGAAPAGGTVKAGKIWLAFYSKSVSVNIGRGENHGRKVTYTNVVRALKVAGDWSGEPSSYTIEIPKEIPFDGCAVLLQDNRSYAMLGAANVPVRTK